MRSISELKEIWNSWFPDGPALAEGTSGSWRFAFDDEGVQDRAIAATAKKYAEMNGQMTPEELFAFTWKVMRAFMAASRMPRPVVKVKRKRRTREEIERRKAWKVNREWFEKQDAKYRR